MNNTKFFVLDLHIYAVREVGLFGRGDSKVKGKQPEGLPNAVPSCTRQGASKGKGDNPSVGQRLTVGPKSPPCVKGVARRSRDGGIVSCEPKLRHKAYSDVKAFAVNPSVALRHDSHPPVNSAECKLCDTRHTSRHYVRHVQGGEGRRTAGNCRRAAGHILRRKRRCAKNLSPRPSTARRPACPSCARCAERGCKTCRAPRISPARRSRHSRRGCSAPQAFARQAVSRPHR